MKKRILFIMGCLENGGGERSLINLLQLMDYSKCEIDLVLFKKRGMFLNQVPEEVNIIEDCRMLNFLYDDSYKSLFSLKKPLINFIRIVGTIFSKIVSKSGFNKGQIRWKYFYNKLIPNLEKEYDVAVSYLEGETTYFLVDKVVAKRKIAWVHTDYTKINTDVNFDNYYFKAVDKIIGISDLCVSNIKKMFPECEMKIDYLPNLISTITINKMASEYNPIEFDESCYNLVSVGRLVFLKGFDLAIEAADVLRKKGIKFKWFILGSGELEKSLIKQIKDKELEKIFILLGSKENPYPYIKNSDVLIQCSRYEGKSMVLDEAKILNKPIVVTNYDTVKDQISDKEGVVVDITSAGIVEGILKALNRTKELTNYLKNNDYGNEKCIEMYYEVFEL